MPIAASRKPGLAAKVEKWAPFKMELAVMVARGVDETMNATMRFTPALGRVLETKQVTGLRSAEKPSAATLAKFRYSYRPANQMSPELQGWCCVFAFVHDIGIFY